MEIVDAVFRCTFPQEYPKSNLEENWFSHYRARCGRRYWRMVVLCRKFDCGHFQGIHEFIDVPSADFCRTTTDLRIALPTFSRHQERLSGRAYVEREQVR